jgi:hypothetical protein
LAGSLLVAVSGHSAEIDLAGNRILLRFSDIRSARSFQKRGLFDPKALGRGLSRGGLTLSARISQGRTIELFPNPGWMVRLLSPAVRRMMKA